MWREKVRTALGITTRMRPEDDATVACSICHQPTPAKTAHLHRNEWIEEGCWGRS